MDQKSHRVKIPCNHPLRVVELKYAKEFQIRSLANRSHECDGCGKVSGFGYYCSSCEFGAHEECIDFPDIVNFICHSRHPLEKVLAETVDYNVDVCNFCDEELGDQIYHCFLCNFSIDLYCSIVQPPRTIYQPKSHHHEFTLLARKVSFTCNACGMIGDRNPYICIECDFMLHRDCVDLPRVMNINRHECRISRSYRLSPGDWECGVCRKRVDWTFGAFSCLYCRKYVVHSKCATREDVWDGEELEDKPKDKEIERSYKYINSNHEIIHFSHEHNLFDNAGFDAADFEKVCDACVIPINSDPFFKCVQCEFSIHQICSRLPRMKRNIFHSHKLSLLVDDKADKPFKCTYCLQHFDGFRYYCQSHYCKKSGFLLDLRCSTICEPFHHELHPHPLYRTSREHKMCGACGEESKYVLSCTVCEFALGMECATLPRKVKHRCDDHSLSLNHGAGNSSGQLWCDICEGKTDPNVWFYGCDDCGVTLHIKCVLGDMYHFKPGKEYLGGELVPNTGMLRPLCIVCQNRCMFPQFLKATSESDSTIVYACSMECADSYKWRLEVRLGNVPTYRKGPSRETHTKLLFSEMISYMRSTYQRILPLLHIFLYLCLFFFFRFVFSFDFLLYFFIWFGIFFLFLLSIAILLELFA